MRTLLFISLLAIIASCNPQPQACINTTETNYTVGATANFVSCALDAERVVWNFGDGSSEFEGESANHTYTNAGTYQVELKALSKKDKKWDRATLIVNVTEAPTRYLTRIQLNSFNINNSQGQTWDTPPQANPDIVISYGIEGSASFNFTNPAVNDVALNQLPILWDFSTTVAKPILSNVNWVISILDNDGVGVGTPAFEDMSSFTVNPATADPDEPGIIRLTQSNFQLELHYIEL